NRAIPDVRHRVSVAIQRRPEPIPHHALLHLLPTPAIPRRRRNLYPGDVAVGGHPKTDRVAAAQALRGQVRPPQIGALNVISFASRSRAHIATGARSRPGACAAAGTRTVAGPAALA